MNLSVRQENISSVRINRDLHNIRNMGNFLSADLNNNFKNDNISFGGINALAKKVSTTFMTSAEEFANYEVKKARLNELWGGGFSRYENELKEGWTASVFAHRIRHNSNQTVTFVEDGILPKFVKSALYPVKDLWIDLGSWILRGVKKIPAFEEFAARTLESAPFKKRAETKHLEEIFCRLEGAFADLSKGEKITNGVVHIVEKAVEEKGADAIDDVQKAMLHAASSVKGNYKTADERTINRLSTGFVSASMAGIDFYNISRMQNDDDTLAKKSQKKRFKQESSRICMSAAMTFLTLGALSKYANKNKYIALATISGTTLVSEILSRIISGMPLRPLKPEEVKDFAKKQELKKARKKDGKANIQYNETEKPLNILENTPDVFGAFKGLNKMSVQNSKNSSESKTEGFKGIKQNEKEAKDNSKEASPLNLQTFLRVVGVLFASGITICFARSRSEKFNSLLKNMRSGLDDAYNLFTKKDYIVPEKNVNEIIETIGHKCGFKDCAQKYRDALSNTNADETIYERVIQKIDGKDVECIKLGKVDKKFVAPIVKAVTYPFAFLWGAMRFPVKIIRTAFEKETSKGKDILKSEDFIGLYKTFNPALEKVKQGKMTNAELMKFVDKILIGASDKTGKSTYKNSSLAAISRPIVTLIASYFFVNDYRNEVLLTSNGKDVEGANAVAKERVMHKVSNFFFNAMFMNLFNSVFEKAYHGSLIGAGAVAAATEFTNENVIRKSIGVPTKKMSKEQIEEHDRRNLTRDDFWGKYFRFMSKLTGKKSISQKVKDEQKKKQQKT